MLKLQFVVEAVDRASAIVRRVNSAIDRIAEPVRKVRASFNSLLKESGLDRIRGAFGNLADRGSALRDTLRGIAGGIVTVAAATGGLLFGFKRIADQVDGLSDTAKMLGIATEQLSKMGYAAQLNGSSQEEMGDALRFLSRNMVQAIDGSKEAQQWFGRVGISLFDLKKMNAPQVFEAIADKFNEVGDAGLNSEKKVALMNALFGRSGPKLKQVLDLGSQGLRRFYEEAERLGAVVRGDTADAMGDFNDSVDRMKGTLFGVLANALTAVAPLLSNLVDRVTQWATANKEVIATNLQEFVQHVSDGLPAFVDGLSDTWDVLTDVIASVTSIVELFGGWKTVLAVLVGFIVGKALVAMAGLATALWGVAAAFLATPFGLVTAGIAAIVAGVALLIKHWDRVKEAAVEAFNQMLEGLQRLDKMLPEWFKNGTVPGAAFTNIVNDVLPAPRPRHDVAKELFRGNELGLAPPLPSAVAPAPAVGKADVGGTLKITIDQEGRARVAQLQRNSPEMDYEVYLGTQMVTP